MSKRPSLSDLILTYFKKHPYQDLAHGDWVDEISRQYMELKGRMPRDPWRAARKLYQDGYLVKVKKGIYKYDPGFVQNPELEDFTEQQKQIILERDGYRCVECGLGRANGVELHVDHIRPKDKGGKATIENGQTLCAQHNFLKKNDNATQSGKKRMIRLYELAKGEGNQEMMVFCREALEVYDKHNINSHIKWTP